MNDEEDCLKGLKKEEIKLILYNNKEAIGTILPKIKNIKIEISSEEEKEESSEEEKEESSEEEEKEENSEEEKHLIV